MFKHSKLLSTTTGPFLESKVVFQIDPKPNSRLLVFCLIMILFLCWNALFWCSCKNLDEGNENIWISGWIEMQINWG